MGDAGLPRRTEQLAGTADVDVRRAPDKVGPAGIVPRRAAGEKVAA
jgi:hypothetical protein